MQENQLLWGYETVSRVQQNEGGSMNWHPVEPPKRKADYRDKYLRLRATPPPATYDWKNEVQGQPLPVQPGDIAQIYMRRAYRDIEDVVGKGFEHIYGERVLELKWICPHCGHSHRLFIPEAWISEGKAEFVE